MVGYSDVIFKCGAYVNKSEITGICRNEDACHISVQEEFTKIIFSWERSSRLAKLSIPYEMIESAFNHRISNGIVRSVYIGRFTMSPAVLRFV